MLKDKLTAISDNHTKHGLCAIGRVMGEMDSETRSAFVKAMKSAASSPQIMEILKEEGMDSFGITHLRDKRRECFKQETECFCIKETQNG